MRAQFILLALVGIAANVCSQGDDRHKKKLPDLVLDLRVLMRDYRVTTKELRRMECAVEENCLDIRYGFNNRQEAQIRELFRFNVQSWNLGEADARPPQTDKSKWTYHKCHEHLHGMDVFATFNVLAGNDRVASGMKASFCMEDSMCTNVSRLSSPPFTCDGEQGIHIGCADLYFAGLDCQWVDLTYLQTGRYQLQVVINPEKGIEESDYDNNACICNFDYRSRGYGRAGVVNLSNCHYIPMP